MKITSVDVYQIKHNGDYSLWKPILCRINTDEGIYGWGEAGVAYGSGSRAAFGMIQDLAEKIIGMDPMNNEVIWDKLYKQTFWGQGGGTIVFAAMSAIDIALMDIKGKALGVPVYKLLGGKKNDKLRCYASQLQFGWGHINEPSYKKMPKMPGDTKFYVDSALKAVAEGYDAIKIDFICYDKDGSIQYPAGTTNYMSYEQLEVVEDRVKSVREAVGPAVDIIVENHSYTDAPTAIQLGRIFEKYRIYYYEETVGTLNPSVQKYVQEKVDIPIASGERIYTRWGYLPFLQDNSVQVIQPDLCLSGGITETKKICDLAYIFDVTVQGHVCGSPISLAACLQLEAAIPNFCIHEHHVVNTMMFNREICVNDYQPVNGYYEIPELPGIGNDVNEDILKQSLCVTIK